MRHYKMRGFYTKNPAINLQKKIWWIIMYTNRVYVEEKIQIEQKYEAKLFHESECFKNVMKKQKK